MAQHRRLPRIRRCLYSVRIIDEAFTIMELGHLVTFEERHATNPLNSEWQRMAKSVGAIR